MSGEFKMTTRQRRVLVMLRDGDWHRLSCFDEMFAGTTLEDHGFAESRIIAGLGADWAEYRLTDKGRAARDAILEGAPA